MYANTRVICHFCKVHAQSTLCKVSRVVGPHCASHYIYGQCTVLGNVLKQWNKHHIIYMSNAAMPCKMLKKEFCMHFVSLSPYVAPL